MTHLSKDSVDKKTAAFLANILHETLAGLKPKDIDLLEELVISKTELQMIKKRLGIIWLLNSGVNTEEICQLLKVTRQTISRVYMSWKLAPKEVKQLLSQRLSGIQKGITAKELLKAILDTDISLRSQLRRLHRM